MSDVIAAVVEYLGSDMVVSGQVSSSKIFGGEMARSENPNLPERAIVVADDGGGGSIGSGYEPYSDSRVEICCYGATPHEASTLSTAVFKAMKALRTFTATDGTRIYWAKVSAKSRPERDPVTQWPMSVSTFQVLAAD